MTDAYPVRGLMLDPARLTERHEYYLDLMPLLAKWGYNMLWWHFSDDEGFALELEGHPELASPFALSPDQTRQLIEAAMACGITVVPEVESLGHTLSITSLPQYRHLFNGNPRGHNAICPSHPDTLPLLAAVITETAALFPGPFLHAGLDESVIGNCQRCRRRQADNPPWRLFAEHVTSIHRIVSDCGKKMIMWADAVEKHPELLRQLPLDIVLAHWHYREIPRTKIRASADAGFKVICVPAISEKMTITPEISFRNVDQMSALATELGNGCLGVCVCWWESFRVLRDAMYPAIAYAGRTMSSGRGPDPEKYLGEFCRDFFAVDDPCLAATLQQVHGLSLGQQEMHALYPEKPADLGELPVFSPGPRPGRQAAIAGDCAARLNRLRSQVGKNRPAFESLVLAAEILAGAYENGRQLDQLRQLYRAARGAATADGSDPAEGQDPGPLLLKVREIRDRVAALARRAAAEWDRTRYPEDAKKDNSSPRIRQRGARALLPLLLRSTAFFTALADGQEAVVKSVLEQLASE